jgi:hypothetical protein
MLDEHVRAGDAASARHTISMLAPVTARLTTTERRRVRAARVATMTMNGETR